MVHRTLGETVGVETVLAAGLWQVEADPNELESAILNLAVNARDAMPDGGRLTIETANAHIDEAYAANHAEVVPGNMSASRCPTPARAWTTPPSRTRSSPSSRPSRSARARALA